MTSPIPLLRVSNLIPFVDFLENLGTPTETLLRQCKLPIYCLDYPNSFVPRHQVLDFVTQAAFREGIPHLGLLVGEKTPLSSYGILGRLVCSSMTLYDAISRAIFLSRLFNSGERYCLVETGDVAYFGIEHFQIENNYTHYAGQFITMLILDLIRHVAGKTWYPSKIFIQTNRSPFFQGTFLENAEVYIGQAMNAIVFPRCFLPLPFSNFNLIDSLSEDEQVLQNSAPALTFSGSLKQALISQLREGYPSIQLTAEIAQMSVRTLQRRLEKEGFTYSQLIAHLRYKIAVKLLQDSSLKIIEIAEELGYKDPAHFTRAFKRWTGVSPRTFRDERVLHSGE